MYTYDVMYIYIYIYIRRVLLTTSLYAFFPKPILSECAFDKNTGHVFSYVAVSTLLATTARAETLKGTTVEVYLFAKGANQKLHPKPYRLDK